MFSVCYFLNEFATELVAAAKRLRSAVAQRSPHHNAVLERGIGGVEEVRQVRNLQESNTRIDASGGFPCGVDQQHGRVQLWECPRGMLHAALQKGCAQPLTTHGRSQRHGADVQLGPLNRIVVLADVVPQSEMRGVWAMLETPDFRKDATHAVRPPQSHQTSLREACDALGVGTPQLLMASGKALALQLHDAVQVV